MTHNLLMPRSGLDSLRRIAALSKASARKTLATPSSSSIRVPPMPISCLVLSTPKSLAPQILALGVTETAAERIAAVLTEVVFRLKASCESSFQRRCASLQTQPEYLRDPQFITSIRTMYEAIYTKTVHTWTSYLVQNAIPHALSTLRSQPPHRHPFNSRAVPLLDTFFKQKPFPTREDKLELASKCSMSYKQIHTWFQNRRSRCKKGSKCLNAMSTEAVYLEELDHAVDNAILSSNDESDTDDDSLNLDAQVHTSIFTFPDIAPPHAYPTAYPPVCDVDPFPEQRSLQLCWFRVPGSSQPRSEVIDVDELVARFARLTLIEDTAEDRPSVASTRFLRMPNSSPARHCLGFFTVCPRAPHPAMVGRSRRPSRPPCVTKCSSTEGRTASVHSNMRSPYASPSPSPSLTVNDPASQHTHVDIPPRRAKRTLPRRVPKHSPIHLPQLIVSSPSSTTPTRPSSASTSSCGSELDSPVSTPPSTPTDLSPNVVPTVLLNFDWDSVIGSVHPGIEPPPSVDVLKVNSRQNFATPSQTIISGTAVTS